MSLLLDLWLAEVFIILWIFSFSFLLYISVCDVYMYLCEFVHVAAQACAQVRICVHVCGDPSCCQVPLFIVFHFICWVRVAYWTWSLPFWRIWLASLLQGFSVWLPSPGITGGLPHPFNFYLESGDLNSGLHTCITSTLVLSYFPSSFRFLDTTNCNIYILIGSRVFLF